MVPSARDRGSGYEGGMVGMMCVGADNAGHRDQEADGRGEREKEKKRGKGA